MTWVADALKIGNVLITLVYYGAAVWLIYVALRLSGPVWLRGLGMGTVIVAFGYLPTTAFLDHQKRAVLAAKAWTLFGQYCRERAGEKIYKKIEDVEVIALVKVSVGNKFHTSVTTANPLLLGANLDSEKPWVGWLLSKTGPWAYGNYTAVEIVEGDRVARFRATPKFPLMIENTQDPERGFGMYPILNWEIVPTTESLPIAKVAVRWEEISTERDRLNFIIGAKRIVLDKVTKEVLAESTTYLIDHTFGRSNSHALPWVESYVAGQNGRAKVLCPSITSDIRTVAAPPVPAKLIGKN